MTQSQVLPKTKLELLGIQIEKERSDQKRRAGRIYFEFFYILNKLLQFFKDKP